MMNYYSKFISSYSIVTHPLNELLKDGVEWKWCETQQKAFKRLKDKLSNAPVLTHFSDTLPLKLDADASQYGIGAVISHVLPSGEERPIAYASRTLTKSERNYAQIEKEALSIVFGVKKFHQYLYGRKFLLVTDHKPLTTLLGTKSGITTLAAARLQRWALLLAAYQYDIEYRSTVNDKVSREREFALGEQVLVQNFRGKPRWLNGTVAEQTIPVSYKVLVGDQLWKRHVDQMHQQRGSQIDHAKRNANVSVTPPNVGRNQDVVDVPAITSPQSETAEVPKKEPISEPGNDATAHPAATAQPQAQPRYPTRQRKAPQRLVFDSQ